jgi:hypothetical protein
VSSCLQLAGYPQVSILTVPSRLGSLQQMAWSGIQEVCTSSCGQAPRVVVAMCGADGGALADDGGGEAVRAGLGHHHAARVPHLLGFAHQIGLEWFTRSVPLAAGKHPVLSSVCELMVGRWQTMEGARQYVRDWATTMQPEYLMASTPHDFAYHRGGEHAGEHAHGEQGCGATVIDTSPQARD